MSENERASGTSNTPRTDRMLEHKDSGGDIQGPADLCRELERELRDVERERDEAEMALRMIVSRHRAGHQPPIPDTFWPSLERIATRNANPLRTSPLNPAITESKEPT